MAARRSPIALLATLGFATLGLATTPPIARAEKPAPPPESVHADAAEILAGLDRPDDERSWLSLHLDRMNVHRKYGLTYTRSVDAGAKGMHFSVRGPVLGKALTKRRRIGLSFEFHF
ncbi:MAG: hypothetical protein JRH16_17780 [Deltaproteobacteria bacterium]|nr:hypothetical protein [Deltaproteobacteria bacterium]MBW2361042.1 hypothetical protein [Deltaproteobacteria bacterium]